MYWVMVWNRWSPKCLPTFQSHDSDGRNCCILLSGDKGANPLPQRASAAMAYSFSHLFNKYLSIIFSASFTIWGTDAANPLRIKSAVIISEFNQASRLTNNNNSKTITLILNTMTDICIFFPSRQQGSVCHSHTERCDAKIRCWRMEKSWPSWVCGKGASWCKKIERHQIRRHTHT